MNTPIRAALLILIATATSCTSEPPELAKSQCSRVGQRLGETPVKGFIFGELGTKVLLNSCPGVQVPITFIGDAPPEFMKLVSVAVQREDVVGFEAVANGFVVQERDRDPVLILTSLDKLREAPSIVAARETASGQ